MKIIESITIKYFRSVYTLTINNCNDITVITGQNDVGKSNIIKALNLFFNQKTDYHTEYNFDIDYSLIRKRDVKETIRGQQFISISIRFNRGNRMVNSLPPIFTVTRRWDLHSNEYKQSTDVLVKMESYSRKKNIRCSEKVTMTFLSNFLHKIKYIYIPAIKDENVFNNTLDLLQQSLYSSVYRKDLDAPVNATNAIIQKTMEDLQNDFKIATGITTTIGIPESLNFAKRLFQVNTQVFDETDTVTIDKRGDGIKAHYIPKILDYLARNSKEFFIWGFEEPENSYEYRRCIQVAEEFDSQYSSCSQIFLTSHSPAFYNNPSDKKTVLRVKRGSDGKTLLCQDDKSIDEELGYIELYREFIEKVKILEKQYKEVSDEATALSNQIKNIQTPVILTEGKTDAALLKLAISKLGLCQYSDWEIRPIISGNTSNNEALQKYLTDISSNAAVNQLIIGMFDRDTPIFFNSGNDLRSQEFLKISSNIYAFSIPVPHGRPEKNDISIEHYFTDGEIKTEVGGKRLFLGTEFYPTGNFIGDEELYCNKKNILGTIKIIEHESKCYVTKADGTGDYSISKARFVECIEQGVVGFSDISFAEFNKIFDIIKKILDDSTV